jgi:alanine dehydrogenase
MYKRSTIENSVPLREIITDVERAFVAYARGTAQMPAKNYLKFERFNGDLRTMSAEVEEFDLATVKIVNSHPNNPQQHGLASVMALLTAVEPETGFPFAVMDSTELTALRTAAASSIATRCFTPESATVLGIIGAGAQAPYQIDGQLLARDFETILVYDIDNDSVQKIIEHTSNKYTDITMGPASISELLERSDVVVSLTPSNAPLIESFDEINTNDRLHINAMGADAEGKQEWPIDIYDTVQVIVDNWDQARHSGEIQHGIRNDLLDQEKLLGNLGKLLINPVPDTRKTRTLFDSTGLAIQDTAAANTVLESSVSPDESFSFFL